MRINFKFDAPIPQVTTHIIYKSLMEMLTYFYSMPLKTIESVKTTSM